jgi:DNA excision repair protein ERCC-5
MPLKRKNITSNKQGTLSGYFDATGGFGSGTLAPRKRQPYASKRLQQVVSEYRKSKDESGADDTSTESNKEDGTENSKGKQKRKTGRTTPNPPKKRRKVEETSASSPEAVVSSVPDRPLGVSLRARGKKATVIEDSDMSDS